MAIFDQPLLHAGDDNFSLHVNIRDVLDVINSESAQQLIGVCGDWGSGKTSFMHFIEEAISDSATTFWFDSWQYEGAGILYSLMRHMTEGVSEESAVSTLLKSTVVVSGALANLVSEGGLRHVEDGAKIAQSVFGQEEMESRYRAICKMKDAFTGLESRILKDTRKERIVVFLDDLDRCLPENAIKTLEALKNHYIATRTVFLIGVDAQVITRALDSRYSNYSGFDADAYLDKVLTYRLRLPPCPPSGLVALLRRAGLQPLGEDALEEIARSLRDCGIPNPRKTVVLGYRLRQSASVLNHLFETASDRWVFRILPAVLALHEYHFEAFVALREKGVDSLGLLKSALRPTGADREMLRTKYGINLDAYPFSEQKVVRILKVIADFDTDRKKDLHNMFCVAERTPRRESAD